jgi:hypothetical protein
MVSQASINLSFSSISLLKVGNSAFASSLYHDQIHPFRHPLQIAPESDSIDHEVSVCQSEVLIDQSGFHFLV